MLHQIDLSVGEPYSIRDNFIKEFALSSELNTFNFNKTDLNYQPKSGYKNLVRFLEDKHQAPVIMTNGAKQGLSASFYLFNYLHKNKTYLKSPYWSSIPKLAKMYNVDCTQSSDFNSYLCVAPNNPDGTILDASVLKVIAQSCKDNKIPFVHDAAYYSHIYLPYSYKLESFGDVQLYSFSKSLGLSGLRAGYMVVHNSEYYDVLKEYVYQTTVGVSSQTQAFLYYLLHDRIHSYPSIFDRFQALSQFSLRDNRILCKELPIEVPDDIENHNGMFLWAKCEDKSVFENNKVLVESGKDFGNEEFIRMNLAVSSDIIKEVVNRLKTSLISI